MRTFLSLFLLSVLNFSGVEAEPQVVGYQRFFASALTSEGGAILFSELGCANCHGGSKIEIPRSGPSLSNLANRISHDWITAFLKNPDSSHHGSTMPKMTHGLSDPEIEAIAAYLGTLQKGKAMKADRHANAERGSALYHEKGCVACHAPGADFRGPHGSGETLQSGITVSFPDIDKKYSLTSLDDFLSNLSKYRTDGRMPHIELSQEESIDIAAHLIDFQGSDPRELPSLPAWPKTNQEQLTRGKVLVEKLNCAACHAIPGIKKVEMSPIKNGEGFCLSDTPINGLPYYGLSNQQRDSLVAFIDSGMTTEKNATLVAMNCVACHSRDAMGGPTIETNPFFIGNESLADSGRLPPPLTGVGHKLQTKWLEEVFAGKPETRVRPYLETRMPKYPVHAKKLATWLSEIDRKSDAPPVTINPEDLDAGRKLIGINGGVNCIICHNWDDKKSLGIPGPDISSLDQRLRPEWFREYLLNPAGYRPGTLMPPLWPGGHSAVPDVLGGNTERQIAAIWGFIANGSGTPEGFPDRTSGQFELVPKDRPIIQRTFLEKTGAKAILVGFPGEIHLAYDGLNAKPSLIWRGKFFDAYNTWYTRAAPFENPLSEEVYEFAPSGESGRFRGYQLDAKGNPTFLVSRGGQNFEEHFEVVDGKLIRTLTWKTGESPTAMHPTGVEVDTIISPGKQIFSYSWK